MIIGKKSLTLDQMKTGISVYLTEENAAMFSVPYQSANKDYLLPYGQYKITLIENYPYNKPGYYSDKEWPVKIITVYHKDWILNKDTGLTISYNKFSQAICAGAILIDDALFAIVESLEDLSKLNENRWTCAFCGKSLNVISASLRICNSCEKNLEKEKDN